MAISTFYKICENVGIDTGLCVSMCKRMSLFESCYCIKSIQTLQIITIDAFVKKHFHSYFNMQEAFYRLWFNALRLNDNNFSLRPKIILYENRYYRSLNHEITNRKYHV